MAAKALPPLQPLYVVRGQDLPIAFKFPVAPGSLSGLDFVFRVTAGKGQAEQALIEEELDVDVTNPAADEVMATVATDADDWDLPPSDGFAVQYWYDVWCTTDGNEGCYARGPLVIEDTASK